MTYKKRIGKIKTQKNVVTYIHKTWTLKSKYLLKCYFVRNIEIIVKKQVFCIYSEIKVKNIL